MNKQIARIIKHPAAIPTAIGVVAFSGGVVAGYLIGHKIAEKAKDVAEEKFPHQIPFAFPKEAHLKIAQEIVRPDPVIIDAENYELLTPDDDDLQETIKILADNKVINTVNFADDDNWNYDVEQVFRNENENPYVIHKDEYFTNELGYEQSVLTYYVGDDILAGEDDQPVYNTTDVVGEMKFGHGSGDPNVVYIRNPDLKGEYEICKHSGHYAVEIQGLQIEADEEAKDLKHSALRRLRLYED